MEILYITLLFFVGIVAGFQNVMAGGGSLMALPVMIFILNGMPQYESLNTSQLANGTNRVAILIQNVFAVAGFRKKGFSDFKTSIILALFTLPGAILGAYYATKIGGPLFKQILGVVMIVVLILMAQKKKLSAAQTAKAYPKLTCLAMFGIGFYGGFIQAGVGVLFMIVLHGLMNLDLVKTNMHKVFIVLIYTVPALIIFTLGGKVIWWMGLLPEMLLGPGWQPTLPSRRVKNSSVSYSSPSCWPWLRSCSGPLCSGYYSTDKVSPTFVRRPAVTLLC